MDFWTPLWIHYMTFKIWADLSCNYWLCKQSQRNNWPSYINGAFIWGISVDAWQRAYLKLGADATIIVTTTNHITFPVLHKRNWLVSVLGYLQIWLAYLKAIWLADACVETWKVEFFLLLPQATPVTQQTHNSVLQCMMSPIQSKREAWTPMPHVNAP